MFPICKLMGDTAISASSIAHCSSWAARSANRAADPSARSRAEGAARHHPAEPRRPRWFGAATGRGIAWPAVDPEMEFASTSGTCTMFKITKVNREGSMSVQNRRDFLKISGGALAASSLAGVPSFAQAGPVKVGVLASRSGVLGSIGECALITTQWWTDRVNAAGGILGRKVELVVEEETMPRIRSSASQARTARQCRNDRRLDLDGQRPLDRPDRRRTQDDLGVVGRNHPERRHRDDPEPENTHSAAPTTKSKA